MDTETVALLAYIIVGSVVVALVDAAFGVRHIAENRLALIVSKVFYLAYGAGFGLLLQHIWSCYK